MLKKYFLLDVRSFSSFKAGAGASGQLNSNVSLRTCFFTSLRIGYYDDFNITLEPLRLTPHGG
jgi:hypothetical protein